MPEKESEKERKNILNGRSLMIIVNNFDQIVDCRIDFNCFHLGFVQRTYPRGHILIKCRLDLVQTFEPQSESRTIHISASTWFNFFRFFCVHLFILARYMINKISGWNDFSSWEKQINEHAGSWFINFYNLVTPAHSSVLISFLSSSVSFSLTLFFSLTLATEYRFHKMRQQRMSKTKVHFHKMFAIACY